jgi:hypothetical protein
VNGPGSPFREVGQGLAVAGAALVAAGLVLMLVDRIPGLGRLPGDLWIRRERFTLYLPLTTFLIVSVALTILINLFARRR